MRNFLAYLVLLIVCVSPVRGQQALLSDSLHWALPHWTKTFHGEQLQHLPARGIAPVTKLNPGVVSDPRSKDLHIRGTRAEDVVYLVDGVRVDKSPNIPVHAIERQTLVSGYIPARFGNVGSGVVSVVTRDVSQGYYGSIEGISSELFNPYGYNALNAVFGGPLLSGKINFFLAAEGIRQKSRHPSHIRIPGLTEKARADLMQRPQVINVTAPNGTSSYIPFPAGIADSIDAISRDSIAAMLDMTADALSFTLLRTKTFSKEQFDAQQTTVSPAESYNLLGRVAILPADKMGLQLSGQYVHDSHQPFELYNTLYASDRAYIERTQEWRVTAKWQQRLSRSAMYVIAADYADTRFVRYPEAFSRDVRDAMYYGDVDGVVVNSENEDQILSKTPAYQTNAILRRYWRYNSLDARYERLLSDGFTYNSDNVFNLFARPGAVYDDYGRRIRRKLRVHGRTRIQLGLHRLEVGLEFEERTNRSFHLRNGAWLARIFDDGDVDLFAQPYLSSSYEDVPYDFYGNYGSFVRFVGYDFRGLQPTQKGNLNALARYSIDETISVSDAQVAGAFATSPHQPLYYAGYIQDNIEYRDLTLQVGLRVDVFDNNALVLKDPFATVPIVRAGSIAEVPTTIEPDYAVYFGSGGGIRGYRSPAGAYFDAEGNKFPVQDIQELGAVRYDLSAIYASIFEDYRPRLNFLPRVGVTYAPTSPTLLFASYNKLAKNPDHFAYESPRTYIQLFDYYRIGNPNLEPVITTQYEIGIRQQLTDRLDVQLTGYYTRQKNRRALKRYVGAFPGGYQTYANDGSATIKGAMIELMLAQVDNIGLQANYTLQKVSSEGLYSEQLLTFAWGSSRLSGVRAPAHYDQTHTANLILEYRLDEDEGPSVWDRHLLENVGVDLTVRFQSGSPYTPLENTATPIYTPRYELLSGPIYSERKPWISEIDLLVDRRFDLGDANLTAFLWIQNLLNTRGVTHVYGETGLADQDGYLTSADGLEEMEYIGNSLGQQAAESFGYHYRTRVNDPYHFAPPRRARIGLRLSF